MDEKEILLEHLYSQLQVLEGEIPLSKNERLKAIASPLLSWYEKHRRILPWREDNTPYRVWVSEIMLQQTRVEAVKPYFTRFMEVLPEIKDLSEVEQEQLLKLWEGLGYYSRARNLQKAARCIMEEYGGCLPASYEALLKLPGIGSYTAGAIASMAYGLSFPAVDGNVLRVVSRLLGSLEDIMKASVKKDMERILKEIIPKERAGDFNQALIELGALICVPNGKPKCSECPLSSLCIAKRNQLTSLIPVKMPKKKRRVEERTVFLLDWKGKIGIQKRPDQGLLASMYEYPSREGKVSKGEVAQQFCVEEACIVELGEAKHIFSHVEWQMIGYHVFLQEKPECVIFVKKEEIKEIYPVPNAFIKYSKMLK